MDALAKSTAPVAEAAGKIPLIGSAAGTVTAIMAIIVIIGSPLELHHVPAPHRVRHGQGTASSSSPSPRSIPSGRTPYFSILVQCGVAIVLIFASSLNDLLGYFTLVALLKNFLTFGTLIVLRRKNKGLRSNLEGAMGLRDGRHRHARHRDPSSTRPSSGAPNPRD